MQLEAGKAICEDRKDVIILSETGSGKTLAYLIPLVGMLNPESDKLQAMVILPSRELAQQSDAVFKQMKCGLRSVCVYGGREAMMEHREIKKVCPQIIFATPGRINDHLNKNNVDGTGVSYLVIDEFDKCLQMGFRDEIKDVIGKLPNVRRRILLSATDAESIPDFVNIDRAVRIDNRSNSDISERVKLYEVKSMVKDKLDTLYRLLCNFGSSSSIVFLNYRESVERVSSFLREKGFTVSSYHGGLEQREREDALYKFSNGSANVLVSTDLASRGLDIPAVENIIHYHLPQGEDEYTHRVGRTGRWLASGNTYLLLGPEERLPEYIKDEPELYEVPEQAAVPPQPTKVTIYIGKGKKDKISKGDILGFFCKVGGLDAGDIGRIDVKERCSYAAVNRDKYKDVLSRVEGQKLKGVKTVFELIK